MSSSKYWRLVTLLMKKTSAGGAGWEPTPREGVFALSFPEYSVQIALVPGEEHDGRDVQFEIIDDSGVVIDRFRDVDAAGDVSDKQAAYREMERLYEQARRTALGVDKALDKLIEELDKEP